MRLIVSTMFALIALAPAASAFENAEEAKAYIEKHQSDAMPDGYSLPIAFCSDDICFGSYGEMLSDLAKAYNKNYKAQRNVAFCFEQGCDGAVIVENTRGCAWRIVILASGSSSLREGDQAEYLRCISALGIVERATAKAQAAELYRVIYKRKIPTDWR